MLYALLCATGFFYLLKTKQKSYAMRGDGKAENLKKPLLSHAWSAGFSFSKCHLEESAPYDPFTEYTMGVEQFSRFARFWTRGYVPTKTETIST